MAKKIYTPLKEVRSTDHGRGERKRAARGSIAERKEVRFHGVRYEHQSGKIPSHCRLLLHKEFKGNNYQKLLLWKEQESERRQRQGTAQNPSPMQHLARATGTNYCHSSQLLIFAPHFGKAAPYGAGSNCSETGGSRSQV